MKNKRGQMMVLVAIGMILFLGFLGLVIDVGRLYVVRQQLRNACDAAAGAGAAKLPLSATECRKFALEYYCRNVGILPPPNPLPSSLRTETVDGNTFETYEITLADDSRDTVRVATPYEGNNRRVCVRSSRVVKSVFMQLLGRPSQVVGTYAVGLQKGHTSFASLMASNYSGGHTQPLDYTRADGERYSLVVQGNNLILGNDANGNVVGLVATTQNVYIDTNNSIGKAVYGDPNFPNYTKGNDQTSPELLTPTPQAPSGMAFLDPTYYLNQATAQNHVWRRNMRFKNETVNGFYFVYGDITIDKNVKGTATFAATGNIFLTESGSDPNDGSSLVTADTQNKILFYAGANPSLDPTTYFESNSFDPNNYRIYANNNKGTYSGSFYAPFGNVEIESNNVTINGSLVGDTVAITSYANNVIVNYAVDLSPPLAPGSLLLE